MITAVKDLAWTSGLSTTRQIVEALEAVHESGVDYWSRYSTEEFFTPMAGAWSASEHVRHLTRSMAPLLPVLRVPRVALRVMFGSAITPSRSYDTVYAMYKAALAAGGSAGRFTPTPERSAPDAARRNAIMDAHSETLRGLTQAMEKWTESQLDVHRLPHPLMGRLTVREMMLFTLIHNQHHVEVAERRRREAGMPPLG